ncbi:beta strand repeat-containing protein [Bythopirellula polymerisocia]|uniref:Autotransporter-associated beta strand repeat protein n=1 Tax=Bythopirellula polymerisocia TaxID=2528003 RepID=A0A5C6D179_9BACT|nr:hypothetical protein [Bythopirellula polymerisocia]TWU29945.1 hypothetical protein Pla144_07260 [Bythopirellula polymerisocia]
MGVSFRGVLRQTLLSVSLLFSIQVFTHAATRTWIGGNVDWVDNGSTANWNPADEPDSDDEAIFNTANSVNLGSNNSILALTMSGGIDLFTNGNDLTVDGLVQLTGGGTNLFIGDSSSELNADDVTINSGGTVELTGGTLILDEESGTSLLDINTGGTLSGHGTITFADTPILATTLLTNDGTLTALSRGLFIFDPPPVGTLQINDSSLGGRIDLDGSGTAGIVNVNRNQTLDLNVPLSDTFSGTMNLFQNSTFDSVAAWTLDAGALNANNGATGGIPAVPAGKSTIAGGNFTQTGGTLNVVDDDGVLQFDSVYSMSGGTLVNNGLLIFNNTATISALANITMPTTSSSISVEAGRTVTISNNNFDLDGSNALTNAITVNDGALLQIGTTDYDPDAVTNRYDGTINLNGGDLLLSITDPEFVMDGILNMSRVNSEIPSYSGVAIDIGNDVGILDAELNISGIGISQIGAQIDFNSDAKVNVAFGAVLQFVTSTTVNFDTVNGVNNASFSGAGTMQFNGTVNVNEAVTLNMVGGEVDLDGNDLTGEVINIDAPLVINVATFGNFGRLNSGGGINTLDINARTAGTTGKLTVNLDNPANKWALNSQGVMNLSAPNGGATMLDGSEVDLNGTVNALGGAGVSARVNIEGTINIAAASSFTLQGGNFANVNRLSGGTINGPGSLSASSGHELQGFGVINAKIEFSGAASLRADDGTLMINGTILDVDTLGTVDADGILNVANPWFSNVADHVVLKDGELKGGTITNNNSFGITGHGLLSSRVINRSKIVATDGTLVVETAANDNDWDGDFNSGDLAATGGSTLEVRDNMTFDFTGNVTATGGSRVFSNGFALDFNSGSTLQLQGSSYESTNSTDIGGILTTLVGGTESKLKVAVNNFLTFQPTSVTTLGQNLRLENNNIRINAGATFSGAGAIIITDSSHLIPDNSANINALLVNEGTIRVAGFDVVGAATVKDYQQMQSGELFVELTGTLLNQFDRLAVTGQALLDGYLNIDIDGPFVPALGNTFNILTASSGVFGTFNQVDISGMPAGLTFHLNYLANAVQLQVVSTPFFSADFDHDGDVDATDLTIWKGAYGLNQLGDADGDNDSDGHDFLLWQRQFGSAPLVAAATAVPEPGAILLMLAGVLLAGVRRF